MAGGGAAGSPTSTGGDAAAGKGGTSTQGGSGGTAAGSAGASGGPSGGAGGGAGSGGGTAGSGGSGGGGTGMKTKGCGAASWPKTKTGNTIMVGNQSRSYNLRVPENYDTNHPYRLIFAYHWLNGTAAAVSEGDGGTTGKPYYGLWDLSEGSTIFVAPQGINNGWSDSGNSKTQSGQDIAFTKALLAQLQDTLCIDTTRIFAEGFSMGGSMSYAAACAMGGDVFRGIAVHSGGPMSGCVNHDKPVAYFMTHGINDSVCKYPAYGVPQLKDFGKVNGCTEVALPTPTSSDKSCVDYTGCSAGFPARACLFVGDHTPSPGGTSKTWVPAETWKFISQF